MSGIQFVLISLLLLVTSIYLVNIRSRLLGRLSLIALGLTGLVLVLNPLITTRIAKWLGVGRGTDLLLYLGLLGLALIGGLQFSKLRHLDSQLTELARRMTFLNVQGPSTASGKKE